MRNKSPLTQFYEYNQKIQLSQTKNQSWLAWTTPSKIQIPENTFFNLYTTPLDDAFLTIKITIPEMTGYSQ